jgi:hypothetical protein
MFAGRKRNTRPPVDMRSNPRDLEQALADLIKRRDNNALTPNQRALIDRMIADLEAEINRRRRERPEPPARGHQSGARSGRQRLTGW